MPSRCRSRFVVFLLLLLGALGGRAAGPEIHSGVALIIDHEGNRLFERNATEVRPIASITKLMTAMVVIDAEVPLEDRIAITEADRDRLRWSRSRLLIDEAILTRRELLHTALMSSDNRAAAALGRTTFAGGTPAFVAAMNEKARALGMYDTTFADASGLDGGNQSTAEDLVRLLNAAARYPLIRAITATGETSLRPHATRPPLQYRNTNPLTRDERWTVELSKTGYLNEAGRCLVMQAVIENRRVYAIFLNAQGQLTPIGDANRLRHWLQEAGELKAKSLSAHKSAQQD